MNGFDALSLFERQAYDAEVRASPPRIMPLDGYRTFYKGYGKVEAILISTAFIGMERRSDSSMTTSGARMYCTDVQNLSKHDSVKLSLPIDITS